MAAEDISQNAGVAWNGAQISEPMTEAAAWAYAEAFVRKKTAALPIQNLSLMQSQLLKDGKTIDLIAHYQVRMPFPVLGVRAVEQTNRSFRYAWTGLDGPVDGAGGRQDADEAVCAGRKIATKCATPAKKWTARQYVRHTMTILARSCRNRPTSAMFAADAENAKDFLSFIPKLFTKAAHGMSFLAGLIKKDTSAFQIQKKTGDELLEELQKVKRDSNEYRDRGEIDDRARVEREKAQKLISFRYKVKDSSGKVISNTFEATNKQDVIVFLRNEGYEVIEVKERSKWDIDINFSSKISNGELSFLLTQLSTYIKAGIPLINGVRILAKQTNNQVTRKTLNKVVYELVLGEKFSVALEKQGKAFPTLLINMVKTSEMTGDLAGTLDEMADYYTEIEKSRKAMISAMVYPSVILTVAIAAVVFIIIYVVPQFVGMFESNNAKLPAITVFIINASNFLGKYWWVIILILIGLIILYRILYKNVKEFRKAMQTFFMHLPVIGNVIIYNEVANLTRTFSSLLNHSVFITDSMDILSKITNNEVYKEIINRTLITLSKGGKISDSFKGEWAFPVVAYEMLVTGESTGQLALMMEKVADHYQNLHANAVTTIKSLIEPIIICFLAVAVGFIIMSIILPMFDLYGQL